MSSVNNEQAKENENDVPHSFRFYIMPGNFQKIAQNRKMIFGFWGLFVYIAQFLLIIALINVYSDKDRLNPCDNGMVGEDASEVYDPALAVLAAYHLLEWFRIIIFLIAVFLGANMMYIYYFLYPIAIYGMIAYFIAHARRFNDDGKSCEEAQEYRANVLIAEVVIFWTSFIFQTFPQILLKFMSRENIEEALNGEGDDDEGEGEGEGEKKEKD